MAIVLLVHIAKVRRTRDGPVFEMAVSSVAFVAWATALTDTPLRDLSWYKVEIGGFIVLATTALIGLVADALDRNLEATPIDSDRIVRAPRAPRTHSSPPRGPARRRSSDPCSPISVCSTRCTSSRPRRPEHSCVALREAIFEDVPAALFRA